MALEIERKFLLLSDAWRALSTHSERMAQGYLGGTHCSVRVRIAASGCFLNIKSRELGVQRLEFEYPIPVTDAEILLNQLCDGAAVSKTRHFVPYHDVIFEIDEFDGANAGLVVAEVELTDAAQQFAKPAWLGAEVTDEARYYNSNLVSKPFSQWHDT